MDYYMDNLPSSAVGVVKMFPSIQTSVDMFSDQLIESVKKGEVNPVELLIQLKAMEKVTGRVLKEIRDNFVREGDKYPTNTFELNGVRLEKGEVGVAFDFTVCKDTVWERLNTDSESAETKLKERQEFLKTLRGPLTVVDELSAEIITIYPPKKTSTTSLKVFIK